MSRERFVCVREREEIFGESWRGLPGGKSGVVLRVGMMIELIRTVPVTDTQLA